MEKNWGSVGKHLIALLLIQPPATAHVKAADGGDAHKSLLCMLGDSNMPLTLGFSLNRTWILRPVG